MIITKKKMWEDVKKYNKKHEDKLRCRLCGKTLDEGQDVEYSKSRLGYENYFHKLCLDAEQDQIGRRYE